MARSICLTLGGGSYNGATLTLGAGVNLAVPGAIAVGGEDMGDAGDVNLTTVTVAGAAGASFSGAVSNLTSVDGVVTAAS